MGSINDHAHLLGQLTHAETGQVPKLFQHVAKLEETVEKQLATDGVVDRGPWLEVRKCSLGWMVCKSTLARCP